MENKVYILKVLYNVRNLLDGKILATLLRKYWNQISNPWSNEHITTKQLQELFRMADRKVLMDKKFEGVIDIYRVIDLNTNMAGKSYCTTMKGTQKYIKDNDSCMLTTEKVTSDKILAYFEDRDEVIIDIDDVLLYDSQLHYYMIKWNKEGRTKENAHCNIK